MKILVITQHIFPIQTPRSIRSTELIKEFSRRGFQVDVYAVLGSYDYSSFLNDYPTVNLYNIPIKWQFSPYTSDGSSKASFFDRVASKLFSKVFEFPTIEFLYRIPKILKNRNFSTYDLLISIAVPHQIHWGCASFKIKNTHLFPKKWIADCGDPFMNNDSTDFHFKYYRKFEHSFCETCDYISVPHENAIGSYYKEYRKKIKVIPQGYEFEDVESKSVTNSPIKFAYAGIFIKKLRDPRNFFDYLSKVNIDFEFHIFTTSIDLITPYIINIKDKVFVHKPISRDLLIQKLSLMDFLVNIENNNLPFAVPSKLIDYSIAKRPILSLHPINTDEGLIEEFLNRDYSRSFKIRDLNQYNIKNVVNKFIELSR